MFDAPEGHILADKYRLDRKIGEGGMGVVYFAEQLPLMRRVAVKLLRDSREASDEACSAFLQEAALLSGIEHPSIVQIIDANRTDSGRPFLVFEYLEGCTLKRLLNETHFLPWRWSAAAMIQVLDALVALHERHIVHRDVKPSNCFCIAAAEPLAGAPRIKLIDFGIARIVHEGCRLPAAGTPGYCLPQECAGEGAHFLADIYAVGASLYEMLTGELFASSTESRDGSLLRPPSSRNPGVGIPVELDRIVMRALAFNPSLRFESAADMRQALAGLLLEHSGPETVSSLPPSSGHTAPQIVPRIEDQEVELRKLRSKVEQFWIAGVLRSTKPADLAAQEWTQRHDLVDGLALALEPGPPLLLPGDRSIDELFSSYNQSLLVVGGAGIGKTTQLLVLVQHLLNVGPAVPVVFALSTWNATKTSFPAWLESELHSKYQVPKSLAKSWLAAGRIMPMVDGLDEVPATERVRCVTAINEMLSSGVPFGFAITSRLEEYRVLPVRLRVHGALQLGELTRSDVIEFLERHLPASDARRLVADEDLLDLAKNPLVLSMLASLNTLSTDSWLLSPDRGKSRFHDLLEIYVRRMLTRSGKRKLPCPAERFIQVVEQLAYALKRRGHTIFQIDEIQPSCLTRRGSLFAYAVGSRVLAASLLASSVILTMGRTPLENGGFHADLQYGLSLCVTTVLGSGVIAGLLAFRHLRKPPSLRSKTRHWLEVLAVGVLGGVFNALVCGHDRHVMAAILAFEVGMLFAPLLKPHAQTGRIDADVNPSEPVHFGLRPAWRAFPWAVLAAAIPAWVMRNETDATASWVTMGYVFSMWLILASTRGRKVGGDFSPNGVIRRSLRVSLLLAAVGFALTSATFAVHYGLLYGSYVGLTTAAVLFLSYGGYCAIQHWLLRGLLRLEGFEYCDAAVLDAATDRAFLHRVGSGYLFLHGLLADHLANRYMASAMTRTKLS